MAHAAEVFSGLLLGAELLYWAAVEGLGPTPAEANQALLGISELPAVGDCWLIIAALIARTAAQAQWVQASVGIQVRAVQWREVEYPEISIRYIGPGNRQRTITAKANHWARYIAGDFESLRRVGQDRTHTLCIEHTCDCWQAFNHPNRRA